MRIGVTGYARLSSTAAQLIAMAVADAIRPYAGPALRGVTCLCHGADLIFARQVVAAAGVIEAVIPAADYRSIIPAEFAADYDTMIALADRVCQMPYATSDRFAFKAASEEMLRRCDLLLAIWDGSPSRELGDTADIVAAAYESGVPVRIVWPNGADHQ